MSVYRDLIHRYQPPGKADFRKSHRDLTKTLSGLRVLSLKELAAHKVLYMYAPTRNLPTEMKELVHSRRMISWRNLKMYMCGVPGVTLISPSVEMPTITHQALPFYATIFTAAEFAPDTLNEDTSRFVVNRLADRECINVYQHVALNDAHDSYIATGLVSYGRKLYYGCMSTNVMRTFGWLRYPTWVNIYMIVSSPHLELPPHMHMMPNHRMIWDTLVRVNPYV